MTAQEMLKKAGFPNTEAGRKAFYKKYPTKESFMKKYAKGGNTELAFPQAPNSNQFYNIGVLPNFPGPYYAHGGSHMPLVHYQEAGEVDPRAAQAMMDNEGGNIPLATRQPGGYPVDQLPRFEDGGIDPKSMAEQILAIKEYYSQMTPRELQKELDNLQEQMSSGYNDDPAVAMKQSVITELLGEQSMPMAQTGGIAFPQQPDPNQFFTGASFNNQYRKGGQPCYECGGMYDAGGNTPFNYGYFPVSFDGGGNVGLDTANNTDYLSYATGGQSPQGLTMDDYRNSQNNQFKDFLSNNAQSYMAGQAITQGQMQNQMPQPPQNQYGGYDAMLSNAEEFSDIDPINQGSIADYENAAQNQYIEGAGQNLMGNIFNLMAAKQADRGRKKPGLFKRIRSRIEEMRAGNSFSPEVMYNKTPTAAYGYSVNSYQAGGTSGSTGTTSSTSTTGSTGTTASNATNLSKEEYDFLKKLMQQQQATQGASSEPEMIYNPYFGEYVPLGGYSDGDSGYKYKLKYRDASGKKLKLRGHGALPFPYAQEPGARTAGTQGSTVQVPPGMNPADFAKYMEAMKKAGFRGNVDVKRGLFGNPKRIKYSWGFYGDPGMQQDPASNIPLTPQEIEMMGLGKPQYRSNPVQSVVPPVPTSQYPANIYDPRVQDMNEKMMDESGADVYGFRKGGSRNSDVIWMDEDDIRRFEAGGGVLEYLDGGEFKQYY